MVPPAILLPVLLLIGARLIIAPMALTASDGDRPYLGIHAVKAIHLNLGEADVHDEIKALRTHYSGAGNFGHHSGNNEGAKLPRCTVSAMSRRGI